VATQLVASRVVLSFIELVMLVGGRPLVYEKENSGKLHECRSVNQVISGRLRNYVN
jgi:hypothetical protein